MDGYSNCCPQNCNPIVFRGSNYCSQWFSPAYEKHEPKSKLQNEREFQFFENCSKFRHLDTSDFWKLPKMNSSPMNHSQFLPEFLLGDDSQVLGGSVDEGMASRLVSPSTADSSFMTPSSSALQHISPHSRLTPFRPDYNRGTKARLNGPPIASLFDEKPEHTNQNGNITSSSPTNQMETSPDNTQDSDGHWIVVFGFPSSHSAHILSIFSQLGNVLEHSLPPSGNWMFLKYSSRIEVRKALTYDKRIVNGNIMIGVAERKNMSQMRPITGTPNPTTPISSVKSPGIRYLNSPKRDIQGNDPPPVPQKDTSVVARAMDLIFGW